MPDPETEATIRAAVEAIVPPTDGWPGGVALGVDRLVAAQLEGFLPGFPTVVGVLLDAYAADVRPGASFVELSLEERGEVFRLMGREESQDVREALGALLAFTMGGAYSESTGADPATGELRPPAAWSEIGFPGPVLGHPRYREAER